MVAYSTPEEVLALGVTEYVYPILSSADSLTLHIALSIKRYEV